MKIRLMGISDYNDVYALWENTPGMGMRSLDDSWEGIEKFLRRNPTTNFIALSDSHVCGCILCGHDGRRAYIYHTCVEPAFRGQGIGRALTQQVLSALREEGIHKAGLMVFKTNEPGNSFWQKTGWIDRTDLNYYSYVINEENQ